jgi:hypothetical protein
MSKVEFTPAGAISNALLVSPESELLIAPNIVSFLNGATSLIKLGLTDCDGGLGLVRDNKCWTISNGDEDEFQAGNLTFSMPGADAVRKKNEKEVNQFNKS